MKEKDSWRLIIQQVSSITQYMRDRAIHKSQICRYIHVLRNINAHKLHSVENKEKCAPNHIKKPSISFNEV